MNCPFCKAEVFLADVYTQDHADGKITLQFSCFRCQKTFRAGVGKEEFKEIKL